VERVLRNRRAAQSSRERKRLEVEALEIRNQELETMLHDVQKTNLLLMEELNKFQVNSGVVSRSSNPVTLSQELFSSQNSAVQSCLMAKLNFSGASSATVNPASLSPELAPVPDAESPESSDDDDDDVEDESEEATTATISVDLAQHPAEMLYDLQCHQSTEMPRSWLASQSQLSPALRSLQMETLLIVSSVMLSVCQRPLTQIAMSLRAGFSLRPTPSILRTIIWLVTLPPSFRTRLSTTYSTSQNTSTTTHTAASRQTRLWQAAQPSLRIRNPASISSTLRLKSLQKILSSSSNLARPLMDATMEVLRLVSERCEVRAEGSSAKNPVTRDGVPPPPEWLHGAPLPSKEVLLTLLWALRVEEGKRTRRELELSSPAVPKLGSRIETPTSNYILRAAPTKRKLGEEAMGLGAKRTRLD
jgi:transcriptional activator HAC1